MRVAVDDATIDVATDGSGDAIVLVHGFPLTRDIWDAQAAQLARGALVIRPDLRGMGRSSVPGGPYLMETLASDVAAVLDALAIERTAIVGHSLGGYVALAFCRMFTERVTRLALVCSRLASDSADDARSREDLANRVERENRIDPVIDAYLPRLFALEAFEARSPAVVRAGEIARRIAPDGAAAMLRGMAARVDSRDIAGELGMPVLVVVGAVDQVVSMAESLEMVRAFPAGELAVMGGSGHLPMLEEPEALARVLETFAL